ncbi:preprotein translocase subunit SecE [Thermomonas paludicola]|uniref:preprotein translocase subunit SecE n=1 Tax=Thermomonas paludicola TaxID=2884874 RepID=UPI002114D58E|nr:preprotein translocase subunit SecE [Thermomonas paludicola]
MTSNSLSTQSAGSADIIKYAAALLLVAAGVFAYYWFDGAWPAGVRALVVAAGLVLATVVFLGTKKGAQAREFLSESRFELRKVVWPTRQEATKTMWVVMAAVVIISLILAAFDWIIQLSVKALLGS